MSIHVLIAQGLSQREVARRLGISRNTVARYAASDEVPRYKQRDPRPTKLSPFHDYILERVAAAQPDTIARHRRCFGSCGISVIPASCAVFKPL